MSTRKLIAFGAVFALAAGGVAWAETPAGGQNGPDRMQHAMPSGHSPMTPDRIGQPSGQMPQMMRQHQGMLGGHTGMHASGTPSLPGQGAFGAIQEIVRSLDADPNTDWSKVDLEALRQHLIDMNEVTLHAEAAARQIDGGLEMTVTGSGRTLVAIERMIPAWVQMANGLNGWIAKASALPSGELLTVTASDPKEVRHIRGLGFIGLLASGSWHQPHHIAIAKGEFDRDNLAHRH